MAQKVARFPLTAREREIVIGAVAAKASGLPGEAAKQVLVAVSVLDGEHAPILVWPHGISREEMVAWHEGQATYWRESAARCAEDFSLLPRSAGETQISGRTDGPTVSVETPPVHLA